MTWVRITVLSVASVLIPGASRAEDPLDISRGLDDYPELKQRAAAVNGFVNRSYTHLSIAEQNDLKQEALLTLWREHQGRELLQTEGAILETRAPFYPKNYVEDLNRKRMVTRGREAPLGAVPAGNVVDPRWEREEAVRRGGGFILPREYGSLDLSAMDPVQARAVLARLEAADPKKFGDVVVLVEQRYGKAVGEQWNGKAVADPLYPGYMTGQPAGRGGTPTVTDAMRNDYPKAAAHADTVSRQLATGEVKSNTFLQRVWRFIQEHPVAIAAVLVVLLGLIAAAAEGGASPGLARPAPRPPSPTPAYTAPRVEAVGRPAVARAVEARVDSHLYVGS